MTELEYLRETFDDYEKARNSIDGLPELSLVAVHRTCEQVAVDESLFTRVKEVLAEKDGWARFRSELGWTGHLPQCFKQSGPPIMAEWRGDDDGVDVTWRLTPAPSMAGRALIVSVSEREVEPDGNLEKDEIPALRQRLEVLAHPRVAPFTHVAYDVYWGLPPHGSPSATRRLFDRFAGFSKKMEG